MKPILGLVFGEEGKVNRPIVLENVTCSKVEIEVKSNGPSKNAGLAFECNDQKTTDNDNKTPVQNTAKKQ